jgi:hypothetical protein
MDELFACTTSVIYKQHQPVLPKDIQGMFIEGTRPLPCGDLSVTTDARHVAVPASLGSDASCFDDQQRAGNARVLSIVRLRKLAVVMLSVCGVTDKRVEQGTVLGCHSADFDMLEKLGPCRGCRTRQSCS